VLHYPQNVNKETRSNRRINIALFVFFFLCGVSGLVIWFMEIAGLGRFILSFSAWSHLHELTGLFMFLVMIPHLGHHLKWLVGMARKSLAPTPHQPLKPSMGKSKF
jgi:cytochrome b subunit of formate dehydrogenase